VTGGIPLQRRFSNLLRQLGAATDCKQPLAGGRPRLPHGPTESCLENLQAHRSPPFSNVETIETWQDWEIDGYQAVKINSAAVDRPGTPILAVRQFSKRKSMPSDTIRLQYRPGSLPEHSAMGVAVCPSHVQDRRLPIDLPVRLAAKRGGLASRPLSVLKEHRTY
jgi:hypothetical protein